VLRQAPISKSGPDGASSALQDDQAEHCGLALVLIDVINDFEFPDAQRLYRHARAATPVIAALKARAAAAGVPCIYANDNFGRWRSDFRAQVEQCSKDGLRGAPIVRQLTPEPTDYFVLKPKHSAFYETCLATLLQQLGAKRLILVGFASDNCVSMTATDAYLRGHSLIVPRDASAAITSTAHAHALSQLRRVVHAQTPLARAIDIGHELKEARKP
jgi:nicotinamidase-related amidase